MGAPFLLVSVTPPGRPMYLSRVVQEESFNNSTGSVASELHNPNISS